MASDTDKSLMTQAAELAETVLPRIESAIASAKESAGPLLEDGKELAADKAAAAKSFAAEAATATKDAAASTVAKVSPAAEPESKGGWKKWVFLGTLLAVGAVVFKKLRGDSTADNWQSSYVPTPAPAPVPDPVDAEVTDDPAGASPDEAVADAVEEPHEVTSPDAPAEVVDIEKDKASS